jgi:hypothetical protein
MLRAIPGYVHLYILTAAAFRDHWSREHRHDGK